MSLYVLMSELAAAVAAKNKNFQKRVLSARGGVAQVEVCTHLIGTAELARS